MADVMCNDNRFEVISKAKEHLLEATNIETSPDEMAVLDSFLFRCWQMGWLKQYDVAPVRHGRWTHERLPSTSGGSYAVIRCSECQLQVPNYETRYCPNCGAKMDEEENDGDQ